MIFPFPDTRPTQRITSMLPRLTPQGGRLHRCRGFRGFNGLLWWNRHDCNFLVLNWKPWLMKVDAIPGFAYRKWWVFPWLCKRLPDGIYACPRGWSFNEVEPQTAGSLFLVPQIFCPNLGLSMDKHEQMLWLDSGEPLNYTLSIGVIFSENYLQSVIMILVHRGTTRIRNTSANTSVSQHGMALRHFLAQNYPHVNLVAVLVST